MEWESGSEKCTGQDRRRKNRQVVVSMGASSTSPGGLGVDPLPHSAQETLERARVVESLCL